MQEKKLVSEIKENTFLGGDVRVIQPAKGYRAGMDPVLLAAAVPARAGESIMDAGCGVGSATLCLYNRVQNVQTVGIDVQSDLVELAKKNGKLNKCDLADFRVQDIRKEGGGQFAHIMMNPPFMEAGSHIPSPDPGRAMGRGETEATLKDWIDFAYRNLKDGGRLIMLHRVDRLDQILQSFEGRFGSVAVFPLWVRSGHPAKLVLIGGRKAKFSALRFQAGLTVHNADNTYTKELEDVLVRGGPIELWKQP